MNNNKLQSFDLNDNLDDLTYLSLKNNAIKSFTISSKRASKVTEIYLDSNQLIELDLSQFHSLKKLSAKNNKIAKLTLSKKLKHLDLLELNSNQLTEFVWPHLDISEASITDNLLYKFEISSGLQINVKNNRITTFTADWTQLDISENRLESIPTSSVLKKLHLDIRNNNIRNGKVENINFSNLKFSDNIKLIRCSIDQLETTTGFTFDQTSIKSMKLMNVTDRVNIYDSFVEKAKVRYSKPDFDIDSNSKISDLSINYCDLSNSLPFINGINSLDLSHNGITTDVLKSIKLNKGIKNLDLSFNYIQKLPTNFFKGIVFENLDLSANDLSIVDQFPKRVDRFLFGENENLKCDCQLKKFIEDNENINYYCQMAFMGPCVTNCPTVC